MTLHLARRAMLLAGLLICAAAFAQPSHGGPGRDVSRDRDRFERKARMMRVLAITDALDLTDAQALQLDKTLQKFDAKRRPLQDTIMQGVEVLRRAAQGDANAFGQVDATLNKMVAARSQLHAIDFEMFQEIAKGRSPQERARLALVMARLHPEVRSLAGHMHGGRHGPDRDDD